MVRNIKQNAAQGVSKVKVLEKDFEEQSVSSSGSEEMKRTQKALGKPKLGEEADEVDEHDSDESAVSDNDNHEQNGDEDDQSEEDGSEDDDSGDSDSDDETSASSPIMNAKAAIVTGSDSVKLLDYETLFGSKQKEAKPPRDKAKQLKLLARPRQTSVSSALSDSTSKSSHASKPEKGREADDAKSDLVASDEDNADDDNEEHEQDEGKGKGEHVSSAAKGESAAMERRLKIIMKRLKNNVHRQAKLAKKFEIRRVIRMIQKAKTASDAEKRVANLEARMEKLKNVAVEDLESAALETAERERDTVDDDKKAGDDGPNQEGDEEKGAEEKSESKLTADPLLRSLIDFAGLKQAAKEYFARPERELGHRERLKKRKELEDEKERRRLERQKLPLLCGIRMCTARFATEADRETHRIKRHKTTGDLKKDMEVGLRNNRPNPRERQAFALLKEGGPLEEIDELLKPPPHLRKDYKKEYRPYQDDEKGKFQKKSRYDHGTNDVPKAGDRRADYANGGRPDRDTHRGRGQDRPKEMYDGSERNRAGDRWGNDRRSSLNDNAGGNRSNDKRIQHNDWPKRDNSGSNGSQNRFNQGDNRRSYNDVYEQRKPDRRRDEPRQDNPEFKKARPLPSKSPQLADADEKLHPSWEAKKKLSSSVGYQGSKVEFSDDD